MKNSSKLGIGILIALLVVIVGAAVYKGNPKTQKGSLTGFAPIRPSWTRPEVGVHTFAFLMGSIGQDQARYSVYFNQLVQQAKMEIFDLNNQRITEICNETQPIIALSCSWDGSNGIGAGGALSYRFKISYGPNWKHSFYSEPFEVRT